MHITRQTLGFYRESTAPVWISVSEVLENVLELYRRRIQSRCIKVEKRFGPQPKIRGFPGEIRQVFSNLIVNALEAVGDGGMVKLHLFGSRNWKHPERRGLRVLIADNGPGIAPEHLRRIFEPFYTTKGERGTGLGLWVSSGIIRKYGGEIRVHSSVHPRFRGTAFSVFLPAEPKEEHALKAA
jgi:signal transduction histidine kinase